MFWIHRGKTGKYIVLAVLLITAVFLFLGLQLRKPVSESGEDEAIEKSSIEEQDNPDYELKTIEMKKEEKEEICKKTFFIAEKCRDIYSQCDKSDAGAVLDDKTVHRMIDRVSEEGYAVTCGDHDYNMQNFEMVNETLMRAKEGNEAEAEFYVINSSGIFSYHDLQFADNELIVTYMSVGFDDFLEPCIHAMDKVKVYSWEYTEKGWLIWEKALSRNQEMDMHVCYRILPLEERCREIADRCIIPVNYLCNNLFLTDWDEGCMDRIEFNDLFEFLYSMDTGNKLDEMKYAKGIPKKLFENTIRKYFDITAKELQKYAGYNEKTGRYPWSAAGPWNRMQQFLPFPEVVKCVENEEGTLSVYVEGVFPELGTDCSFRHVVKIREEKDGRWVYCGNKIDWEHARRVPVYRARREYEDPLST